MPSCSTKINPCQSYTSFLLINISIIHIITQKHHIIMYTCQIKERMIVHITVKDGGRIMTHEPRDKRH